MGQGPVGDVPLEVPDRNRGALLGADADLLALRFLRADPAGDAGERIVVEKGLGGRVNVALGDEVDEARDVHPYRAALDAGGVLALDAALGLGRGEQLGEPEVHLLEVPGADVRQLLRHVEARDRHPLLVGEGLALHHRAASTASAGILQASRLTIACCSNSR